MSATREQIYLALFAKLQALSGVMTTSRRQKPVMQIQDTECPAAYQTQRFEDFTIDARGMPPKRIFHVDWVIVVYAGDETASPASALNPILDAVEAVLPPGPQYQTLGGLVSEARINGRILTAEGSLGAKELAVIPIRIVAP